MLLNSVTPAWSTAGKAPQRRRRPARRCFRPQLEILEDRLAPAATFTVNTTLDELTPGDGKLSLREAITLANNHPGPDTIVVPAGVYKMALDGINDNANLRGDFDITDSLTLQGAGAAVTVVDAQHLDRVFDVFGTGPSSIQVTFQGLTIRNGNSDFAGGGILVGNADLVVRSSVLTANTASGAGGGLANAQSPGTGNVTLVHSTVSRNVAGDAGGGLFVKSSSLTIKSSQVRRNLAGGGGGIYAIGPELILTDSSVSGNLGRGGDGGGIVATTATLTNCSVSGNSASGFGGFGGGLAATNTATLTRSTVSGNSASGFGGGIAATTATLTDCTVRGNSTPASGGGLFTLSTTTLTRSIVSGNSAGLGGGGIQAGTVATLTDSTVSENFAGLSGGGIDTNNTATLTRSTVSGNIALKNGGGIYSYTTNLTNSTVSGNTAGGNGGVFASAGSLLNATIADNSAANGGGVYRDPSSSDPLNVKNTLIALNLVAFGGTGPDVNGDFTSQGHNLIGIADGSSSGFGVLNSNADLVGTASRPLDPKLGPLADNGGPTLTHALKKGSPAIDHGDNSGAPSTDQRGIKRPRDGNGDGKFLIDIGAFER